MTYTVWIDDNFHYMDENERYRYGDFESLETAIEVCKKIVDEHLISDFEPGMSAETLYLRYTMFGDDPWVSGAEGGWISAWEYAEQRCAIICTVPA